MLSLWLGRVDAKLHQLTSSGLLEEVRHPLHAYMREVIHFCMPALRFCLPPATLAHATVPAPQCTTRVLMWHEQVKGSMCVAAAAVMWDSLDSPGERGHSQHVMQNERV